MNKNNILVTITLVLIVGLIMLSGCKGLLSEANFESYNIGERFDENRDGYLIKLNNLFFADITYKNNEIAIYKLLDSSSTDYFGNSELYYNDSIDECFCNNNEIIVHSLTKDKYVIIDCNDINNIQSFSETDIKNIDLNKFTEIVLP